MLLSDTPMVRYNARMKPRRPVTRVCLVLPALTETSSRDEASAEHEALAYLIARDLAAHGVSVTRHVAPGSRYRGVPATANATIRPACITGFIAASRVSLSCRATALSSFILSYLFVVRLVTGVRHRSINESGPFYKT